MTRLVKQAEVMRHRRSRARPFVLATVAVSALLAGLGIARQDQTNYGLPTEEISTGRIWVEGTVAPLVGDSATGARLRPAPRVTRTPAPAAPQKTAPISFYDTLGNGGAPVRMNPATAARDRSKLPVPPPRQALEVVPESPVKVAAIAPGATRLKPTGSGWQTAAKNVQSTSANTRAVAAVSPPGSADDISRVQAENADIMEALNNTGGGASEVSSVPLPYTLQVASFSTQDGANGLMGRLKAKDQPAYLVSAAIPGKGTWWRVRVGRYPTLEAAKWARLDLIRLGVEPMVVRDNAGAGKTP